MPPKFPVPPAAPLAKAPAVPHNHLSTAERSLVETKVRRFYEKHNPAKVSEVPSIMEKWTGREHDLIAGLETKYGKFEEPEGGGSEAETDLC